MNSNDRLSQGDLEDLLPWHAAGTLDANEAAEVERALAADPELARRFALVREELTETILLNESLGAPSARAMETLFRAIDQDRKEDRKVVRWAAASPSLGARSLGARIAEFFSPRAMAWTAAAAVVVVMLQAGVIARMALQEPDGGAKSYETASFETASAPVTRGLNIGSYALVRFAPQASMADVNKFLDARNAAIVDGPKPGGIYRVRVAQGSVSRAELGRLVKEMEAAKAIVSFAAPTE
jgi:hypothetical protein